MSDKPFDRVVAYDLAVLRHEHINRQASQVDTTFRELIRQLIVRRSGNFGDSSFSATAVSRQGFFNAAFRPTWSGGMNVQLFAGVGFLLSAAPPTETDIDSVSGLDDMSVLKPVVLTEHVTVAVPTSGALPRIDLIEVTFARRRSDSESLSYLSDPTTGTLSTAGFLTNFGWGLSSSDLGYVSAPSNSTAYIGYKQGVENASPSAPSVTSGYTALCYIYVPAGLTTMANQYIYDRRPLIDPGTVRVTLTKDAGTGGGLTLHTLDAPPGVEVRVVEDTGTTCAFTVYVLAPNAKAVYDAMPSVKGLAHSVTVSQDSFSPSETIQAKSAAGVTLLGSGDVADLANASLAHPTTLTTAIDLDRYCYYVSVSLLRNNATTVDFNPTNATLVTVTLDLPSY